MNWNEVKIREANILHASSLPTGQAGIRQLINKTYSDETTIRRSFSHRRIPRNRGSGVLPIYIGTGYVAIKKQIINT
jgi:hypothetical protein